MKKALLFTTLSAQILFANTELGFEPYYAGTQLAFYPLNSSPGYVGINPSVAFFQYGGSYSTHWNEKSEKKFYRYLNYDSISTGITNWLDATVYFGGGYQNVGSRHSWGVIDTSLYFGIQISQEKKGSFIPDMRILFGETFPTGKYDHLDPAKNYADQFGTGSYISALVFVLGKTVRPIPHHPFYLNLNLYFLQPSSVHVHGLSYYGGDEHTRGRVFPRSQFITNVSIEISLNQNWALGTDINYTHQNKVYFKGKHHIKPGFPSSEQFSLAPCLEYSWSATGCMAIGPWFTIAGRNAPAFFSFLANAYWYY